MRILLVKPDVGPFTLSGGDYVELEPLELEYLAGGLRGHDVRLLDLRYDGSLEAEIERFGPDLVACTAYSVHVYKALSIFSAAKRLKPDVYTVVGGHHATLLPGDFHRAQVDAVVIGEAVFSFRELVEALERGRSPRAVPGIWHRDRGRFSFTGPRNDIGQIDRFPLPDREITRRYRDRYFYLWWRPAALARTSAGCAYRCSFCPIWKAAGGKWAYRSPESVADELAGIEEDFVYFCDDNAFFCDDSMRELHGLLEDRRVNKEYFFFSRADAVVRHRKLVESWAEIGLRQVFLGLEAVDNQKLLVLNKRTREGTNEEAVAILKANGVDPFAGFMVFPDFTADDFDRIYDYVDKLGIYYVELSVLTPAPGSELYWRSRGELTTGNYELFDYMHPVLPTRLESREFSARLARLWWQAYSPRRALRVRPAHRPPLTGWQLGRTLFIALKNYRAIKRSHRDLGRTAAAVLREPAGEKPPWKALLNEGSSLVGGK